MRGWSVLLLVCGCSFEHGISVDTRDADADASASALADAAPLPCSTRFVWTADFTVDPTTLNNNAGPEPDWRLRDGGALPGALADGVWAIADSPPVALETQPKTDFNRLTRATARLRNTSPAGSRGVVFGLNADYSPMTYMPLYLEVRLAADTLTQTATLYGRDTTGEITLASFPDLATGLLDVMLDIDPAANQVQVRVGSASSTYLYMPIPREMNDDRFATIAAYSDSEVDEVRVEVCM
ncbi:MAG TPA: hypothetical protein VFV99_30130 [Kofleriaceae bacterium]|nr:hypothetical protein [Kofleriaceae bacterium]